MPAIERLLEDGSADVRAHVGAAVDVEVGLEQMPGAELMLTSIDVDLPSGSG